MEEKEYINPLGQRVVNCEIGYKVYDAEKKDRVILRVGDYYVRKNGEKVYVFKDRDAFNEKSNEQPCFIPQEVLVNYENEIKRITSNNDLPYHVSHEMIIRLNMLVGVKYRDIVHSYGRKNAESFFNEIEEIY